MEIKDLIEGLHPLERKVLPVLSNQDSFSEIVKETGMQEVEVMRALQWLQNKGVLKIREEKKEIIDLGDNGRAYVEKGLPEERFLNSISEEDFTSNEEIKKKAELDSAEFGASMGILKKNSCLLISKEGCKKTPAAKVFSDKIDKISSFLKEDFPKDREDLSSEDLELIDQLKKRKDILNIKELKIKSVELTKLGEKASTQKIDMDSQDRLTPDMLKKGTWKGKKFRKYDVSINVPKIYGGKKHFVNQAVDYIKKIWLELGFKEMTGTLVQTSFWDLDSLFVPQDHPARQMQDTFYIKDPKKGKLPSTYKKIKKVHENGGDTGSKGWGGEWSKEMASENLLRTHTTVLSAQTISKLKKEDLPAKFFSVNKVFRNEALDWKHLFEFYQVEGIVVDPNATLKHLKGYLKEFYKKMGYDKVRMRPAHFPYTEPSLEVDVFHPVKKEWVELGGAGIFRPEVVKPLLGFDCPVLAWGQGMGRIISEYWKITDIRDLYKNDLKQIREMKTWMK